MFGYTDALRLRGRRRRCTRCCSLVAIVLLAYAVLPLLPRGRGPPGSCIGVLGRGCSWLWFLLTDDGARATSPA